MVDCTDCRTLLVDFERGELDAVRDAAMHAHLSACAPCHAEWQADLAMVDSLRAACAERDFPASILAGVRQAMHAEAPPSFVERLRVMFRPVVAAPIAAALIIAGVFIGREYVHQPQHNAMTGMDYVREHIAQTASLPLSDRAWSTYILTSANAGTAVSADATPGE